MLFRSTEGEVLLDRTSLPEQMDSAGAARDAQAAVRSASGDEDRLIGRLPRQWRYGGRAATGMGNSVRSEVREVGIELERDPVAVVTIRYDFRLPVPRPIIVPGFAPESVDRGWSTQREKNRFAPEP